MKEPDKWCIKVTPENKEAIEKWRTTKVILECKGYTEISFEEFKVYTSKPLKQAVHCETQEEWDFACDKYDKITRVKTQFGKEYNTFSYTSSFRGWNTKEYYIKENYQILSFQEWCDLNGYKIEKEIKFEIGDWVVSLEKSISYNVNEICRVSKISKTRLACENKPQDEGYMKTFDKFRHATPEEIHRYLTFTGQIQQYSPNNHPDEIKSNQEFKVGDWVIVVRECPGYNGKLGKLYKAIKNSDDGHFRYEEHSTINTELVKIRFATPEEINNHLISIGQIPAEKYPFKKLEEDDLTWEIKTEGIRWTEPVSTTNENWKSKMILSIDDEELPMVNIIKTNTIKQLLNND